ncbi:hypothetical protein G6539_29140, partial [Streptomyces albidoflavus]|nr:hypothetical protein [Streptomyces albidoflavus]
ALLLAGHETTAGFIAMMTTPDDLRAEAPVTALLEAGGWRVRSYADEPDRYLVLAGRTG